ncbi:hypothetical protein [Aeromicrobium sp. Leaf291]|uniref:hypothetical protein n=1 Tax=Aeromicrobium sp. Leaf291 TaxID=1736325 RepID=UPI0006FEAD06|nr:hypothetical protein [Aeromicrobium sp. Leaf291]KQP81566.1 hypothetical protein ASF35_16175 [Aeromicrobium sp. Leaf291]
MTAWRYLAQNVRTGAWLHPDLPLRDVEVERAVSAPGGIDAVIAPEVWDLRAPDGSQLLREWQTAIYAEADGVIRGAGIYVRSALEDDGESWSLECPGFTSYPHGIPFGGRYYRWNADPFLIVRDIWSHLQGYANGNIGMVIDDAVSPVRVSPPKPPDRPEPPKTKLKAPVKGKKPKKGKNESTAAYNARVAAWESSYASRRAAYEAAKKNLARSKESIKKAQERWDAQYGDHDPYELSWWEAPDCGSEIDRLAVETPFDYVETHRWNAARTNVLHRVDFGQPRFGRRRNDLRFQVGENVVVVPDTEHDGDEYANGIIALGKGDGRDMLRVEVNQDDGRLRRPRAVPMKDIGNATRLRALAGAELQQRLALEGIAELVVIDHPNAPLGSWSMGDEVALEVRTPGGDRKTIWCRIVSELVRPGSDDRIQLTVVNADRVLS